jgi:hypothetical protein
MARIPWAMILVITSMASSAATAEVTCYVDSVNGDDGKSGLSEAEAKKRQAKLDAACTEVRYKRGSVFPERVRMQAAIKTYANYGDPQAPLPKFQAPDQPGSGPVVDDSGGGGITVDGLSLSGARADLRASPWQAGACVRLGPGSQILNSEISDCELGVTMEGEGSRLQGTTIRDLVRLGSSSSVDSLIDGAIAVMVSASNQEIGDNTFVRCKMTENTGMDCNGGGVHVMMPAGKLLVGLKVYRNFFRDSCGMFDVMTMPGDAKGKFADGEIHHNVVVDSAWLALFDPTTATFENVRVYNNTLVQRSGSPYDGYLVIVIVKSSMPGILVPGTVSLTNNLFVFDGSTASILTLEPNLAMTTNLTIDLAKQDPGFVDLVGSSALDFDLTARSPAIDVGTEIPGNTLDFAGRPVPEQGGKTDIGAFEYTPKSQVDAAEPMRTDGGQDGSGGSVDSGRNRQDGAGKTGEDGRTGLGGMAGITGAGGMQGTGGTPGTGGGAGGTGVATGTGGMAGADAAADGPGGNKTGKKDGCNCQVVQADNHWQLALLCMGLTLICACRRLPRRHST